MNDTPLPSWESMLLCAVSSTPVSTHAGPAELRAGRDVSRGGEGRRRRTTHKLYARKVPSLAAWPVLLDRARPAAAAEPRWACAARTLERAILLAACMVGVGIEVAGSVRGVSEDGRRWSEEEPAACGFRVGQNGFVCGLYRRWVT